MNSTSHLFEIVAHRGVTGGVPENTIPSFERAIELGADAVEFDVRLSADQIPVVFHYFYLHETTNLAGTVFSHTCRQLKSARFTGGAYQNVDLATIPTLDEVLDSIGGRIGLEIEIKGPEPEAAQIVGEVLINHKDLWETVADLNIPKFSTDQLPQALHFRDVMA
jgi:glycerophosphoryl diester phosphodiesterase